MKHLPTTAVVRARLGSVLAVLALALAACDLPITPPIPLSLPTPALAANQVAFTAPVFTSYLHKGDKLPGADVQYVDQSGDTYNLLIDGQKATKKTGDSLDWKGQAAPGVTLDYQLRILGVILDQFEATGPLTIIISDPAPGAGTPPENADLHFDKLVVANITAKVGKTFPGTPIGYAGKTDKGAQLTGIDGYAYRSELDSIDWTGQVRADVWLKLNLRVTSFDDKALNAAGTGEIWIVNR